MHGSCKSVSDGERYIIIGLLVLLVLRAEAVAQVRSYTVFGKIFERQIFE